MRPGSVALLLAGILAWVISFRLKLKQWEAAPARSEKPDWTSWS
jgi:hypothetical protein